MSQRISVGNAQYRRLPFIWLHDGHHEAMMPVVVTGAFPLLARLTDSYGDARFEPSEFTALAAELEAVRSAVTDEPLRALLGEWLAMVAQGEREAEAIYVYAD